MASPTWTTSASGGATAPEALFMNIAWWHRFSAPRAWDQVMGASGDGVSKRRPGQRRPCSQARRTSSSAAFVSAVGSVFFLLGTPQRRDPHGTLRPGRQAWRARAGNTVLRTVRPATAAQGWDPLWQWCSRLVGAAELLGVLAAEPVGDLHRA